MTERRQTAETKAGERGSSAPQRCAAAEAGGGTPRKGSAAGGSGGERKRRRRPPRLIVDPDLCKSCGICITLCPHDVFSADAEGRPVVTDLEACTRCRFCEQHCPDFALQVIDAEKPPGDTDATSVDPPAAWPGAAQPQTPGAEDDEGDD